MELLHFLATEVEIIETWSKQVIDIQPHVSLVVSLTQAMQRLGSWRRMIGGAIIPGLPGYTNL